MEATSLITIGELSRRTGLSVSAIRFYESRGLISSTRTSGNRRLFPRSEIRRLSFALIAQRLGLTLTQISAELNQLPQGRSPTHEDWNEVSSRIKEALDQKIRLLERTRDQLGSCIGCGCLSLEKCALYNPNDRAGLTGAGPRFLLEDRADQNGLS